MTRGRTAVAAAVSIAVAVATYWLRIDDVAGLVVDDAWYIVLAKALASGEGYRLISSATAPLLPAFPPGFPALLSSVFFVQPSYPGNLLLLKLVSIVAMAGVGVACWIDFTRHRNVPADHALWLTLAVVLTPAFVFLATSTVMAECVFTLAQVLAVIAVERVIRQPEHDRRNALLAGAIAGAAMLIRTAGVGVVVASIAYLVLGRRWRPLAIFVVTVAACLLPWQLYASANAATPEQRIAHGGTIVYTYQDLLTMARPGSVNVTVSPVERVQRAARNVGGIVIRDVGAVIVPILFRGASESGEEVISVGPPLRGSMGSARGTMIVSTLLGLAILAGVIRARAWFSMPALLIVASVAMISAVGAQTFRYVVPLTPFLLLFLWHGMAHPKAARIAVLCVLGFHLVDHALYLRVKATATPDWVADAREIDEVLTFFSDHVKEPGAVASTDPGLFYLRTGRKTVFNVFPEKNRDTWKAAGVRYIVALRPADLPPPSFNGRVLYRTGHRLWIIEM